VVEGLDVRKYSAFPCREKCFSLDIPFYRTNYRTENVSWCFYEKVIKVKWPTWRPSVLVAYGSQVRRSSVSCFF
jgi:hypothetical protein